jgi:hypothetical protein
MSPGAAPIALLHERATWKQPAESRQVGWEGSRQNFQGKPRQASDWRAWVRVTAGAGSRGNQPSLRDDRSSTCCWPVLGAAALARRSICRLLQLFPHSPGKRRLCGAGPAPVRVVGARLGSWLGMADSALPGCCLPPVQLRQQNRGACDWADHGARVGSGGIASFQGELTAGSEWSIGELVVKCKTLRMEGRHPWAFGRPGMGKKGQAQVERGPVARGSGSFLCPLRGLDSMLCLALCICVIVASGISRNAGVRPRFIG